MSNSEILDVAAGCARRFWRNHPAGSHGPLLHPRHKIARIIQCCIVCLCLLTSLRAEELPWISLYDGKSLEKWELTDYAGKGGIAVENGTIIMEPGGDLTGIHLKEPPARQNYELEVVARKLQGNDFFCGLTFPVGKDCLTFVCGGWGGTITGISSINGSDASENSTTKFKKYELNKWYRIRVVVTPKNLEAWVDDEFMVDLDLEGLQLAVRAGEIELSQPLGIASYRTRTEIQSIRWRPVK